MSTSPKRPDKELPSTYIVQDRENKDEFVRLALQDHLLTTSMGCPFSEQPEPDRPRQVLDIACGTGLWAIETARAHPNMKVVGIDISQRMITYAREQARTYQVADRVEFHIMDALRLLEFPASSFDMVNLRLGGSFLRTWDWPKILSEMRRVTHLDGLVRITDQEIMHQSTSPASTKINEMVLCAFFKAGHLFTQETTGLVAHLPRLLTQYDFRQMQTRPYALEYQAGTPAGDTYSEDMAAASRTLRPFIQKWGCISGDYDALLRQSIIERQQPDFHATWHFRSIWGRRA